MHFNQRSACAWKKEYERRLSLRFFIYSRKQKAANHIKSLNPISFQIIGLVFGLQMSLEEFFHRVRVPLGDAECLHHISVLVE